MKLLRLILFAAYCCIVCSEDTTFEKLLLESLTSGDDFQDDEMIERSNIFNSKKCNTDRDCGDKGACAWLTKRCYRYPCYNDNNCYPHEYCSYDDACSLNKNCQSTKNKAYPNGKCIEKIKDGGFCLQDSRCMSNHCHSFKCKGLQVGKNVEPNGPCKDNEDCRFEQYCKNKKCTDRIANGSCKNDDQCLSNHCSFWNKCDNSMLRNS